MKHRIAILITCLIALAATAQNSTYKFKDIIVHAREDILPVLSLKERYEIIENAYYGKIDTITNSYGGKSWVDSINIEKKYVLLHETENSTFELLQMSDKVLVIKTVYAPLASSMAYTIHDNEWSDMRHIDLQMDDCHDMPATFIKASVHNDSILLENQTLLQIQQIEQTIYHDCQPTTTIPLP